MTATKTDRTVIRKTKVSALTPEHKAAMARGRNNATTVRHYINALDGHKPRRGPRMTREALLERIDKINERIAKADAARRVVLIQQRMNTERQLENLDENSSFNSLEQEFTSIAKEYSDAKGISYNAWREVGVQSSVLVAAGIPVTR